MAEPVAPKVVTSVTPREMAANFQGVYAAGTTYQKGQWVTYEEALWHCAKVSVGNAPALGSEYWKLVGGLA